MLNILKNAEKISGNRKYLDFGYVQWCLDNANSELW